MSDKDKQEILDVMLKESTPAGYLREHLILDSNLYVNVKKIGKIFDQDVEIENWDVFNGALKDGLMAIGNRMLRILIKDGKIKKEIDSIELDHIRDKKLGELDEELFFSIDEKSNIIDLTEKGRQLLSPNDPNFFVLPDLSMADDADLADEERQKKLLKLERQFQETSEKIQTITQLLKAYSLFEKDVNYVWPRAC